MSTALKISLIALVVENGISQTGSFMDLEGKIMNYFNIQSDGISDRVLPASAFTAGNRELTA